MGLWILCAVCFIYSLKSLYEVFHRLSEATQTLEDQLDLIQWLQKCEERLICGFPLDEEDFRGTTVEKPEYRFLSEWILDLRNAGQAILPTLKGLRETLTFVNRILIQSQTKVAPTRLQAKVSIVLVVILSILLYALLEAPARHLGIWISATTAALIMGGFSFLWIESLILKTLWNGSRAKTETLWLSYFLFPERLKGAIQLGQALDEAWMKSIQNLSIEGMPSELLSLWSKESCSSEAREKLEFKLLDDLRLALQHALYSGTPVSDRIQTWGDQSRVQFEAGLNGRLETLPHRCLQPLYLCVAPAVLGLLGTGIGLEVLMNFSSDF